MTDRLFDRLFIAMMAILIIIDVAALAYGLYYLWVA